MATTCRKCGAELPEGAGRCPSCLALVKPPGFFQRLFGGFKLNLTVNTSATTTKAPDPHVTFTTRRTTSYQIRDAATGETKVYHSLEEIPEPDRERMRTAMAQGPVQRSEQINFIGPDGVQHSYKSLDEVPPANFI